MGAARTDGEREPVPQTMPASAILRRTVASKGGLVGLVLMVGGLVAVFAMAALKSMFGIPELVMVIPAFLVLIGAQMFTRQMNLIRYGVDEDKSGRC